MPNLIEADSPNKEKARQTSYPAPPGMAFFPLLTGILLMVVMTALPNIATDSHGKADHTAALLLFWSMSAGLVRGIGFIPRNWLSRALLSSLACLLSLMLGITHLVQSSRLDWLT